MNIAPFLRTCMASGYASLTASHHPLARRDQPLRVVRILENGLGPSSVGRMVISGRMADVCAELDRLAACESTGH